PPASECSAPGAPGRGSTDASGAADRATLGPSRPSLDDGARGSAGQRLGDLVLEVDDETFGVRHQPALLDEAGRDAPLHALHEPTILEADLIVEREQLVHP